MLFRQRDGGGGGTIAPYLPLGKKKEGSWGKKEEDV